MRKRPRQKNQPVYPDPTKSRSNEGYHDIQVNPSFPFLYKKIIMADLMVGQWSSSPPTE
jgi:hypothetical protein